MNTAGKLNTSQPRAPSRGPSLATVAQLDDFDEIIDVRSQSEFAEDHIPGATNCPVLDDAQRAEVGTIYRQVSAFDAKKVGAALVSANIALHLRTRFHDKPRTWRPLIYCWRGGGRSSALAHVLSEIGWKAGRLDGGYKAYRRRVIEDLATLPARYDMRVVCGVTGTGKSRLLRALALIGEQVLDLEALAAHRGSVLGNLPNEPQPLQKMFESLIWHALRGFDAARPVYVESESKKVGMLRVPQALIEAMWAGKPLVLEAPINVRVALLKEEYAHFLADAAALNAQLSCLASLHGRETIERWHALANTRQWDALTRELLIWHYDPAYTRAITRHYPTLAEAPRFSVASTHAPAYEALARACIAHMR